MRVVVCNADATAVRAENFSIVSSGNTSAEPSVATEFFFAVFVDGYARLTALAASRKIHVRAALALATVASSRRFAGEELVPRTDPSVAVLTGLIIAALYVILLIGFSRESYMRHDAAIQAEAAKPAPASASVAKNVCRLDLACAVPP